MTELRRRWVCRGKGEERKLAPMNALEKAAEFTVREQAAEWLARIESGRMDALSKRQFEAWLAADAHHRREMETLRALWLAMDDLRDSPVVRAELHPARQPITRWWAGFAIASLLCFVVGFSHLSGWPTEVQSQQIVTLPGERKAVALDDGSRLHLDTDSALSIHLSKGAYRIVLERGEAYFEVEHHSDRLFEVEAGGARVVDIGTRFGVRLEAEGRVSVVVAEGEVEVSLLDQGAGYLRLSAGQAVDVASNALGPLLAVDADAALAWREGRLVFDQMPLGQALFRLNRYHRNVLAIGDPSLEKLRVSGVFRVDDLDGFLWALEQTQPIKAVRRLGGIDLVAARSDGKTTPPLPVR